MTAEKVRQRPLSLADRTAALMAERGIRTVIWGDGTLTDVYGASGRVARHPLDAMERVLASLERSPRFEKVRVLAHDRRGQPRTVRGFRFIPADPTHAEAAADIPGPVRQP